MLLIALTLGAWRAAVAAASARAVRWRTAAATVVARSRAKGRLALGRDVRR
jgi:hypothetical protein